MANIKRYKSTNKLREKKSKSVDLRADRYFSSKI